MIPAIAWWLFGGLVGVLLFLDLFVFNRKAHVVEFKEAILFSGFWIGVALAFNFAVYKFLGPKLGLEFLTGFLIEKALSVDNLFVFIIIFSYFQVHPKFQHRLLFWGILGAIVMRAIFIFAGVVLIEKFHWIIYVFGSFLIYTGIKMVTQGDAKIDPEKNLVIRVARRFLPITHDPTPNGEFFLKKDGKIYATMMFIALLVIESTDVVFAVDSIPAILAISREPFIVYTSNIFAILGLRALYFALAGVMNHFHFLKYGLAAILVFVGTKMLISHMYKVPVSVSLGVVAGLLIISILLSFVFPEKKETPLVKPVG